MTTLLQRFLNAVLLFLMAVIPLWFIVQSGWNLGIVAYEKGFREYIPASQELRQLGLSLRLLGGQTEQNGIFISKNGLMRDIDPPNKLLVAENASVITAFEKMLSEISSRKNTYVAIFPTASGVLQQELPRFAPSGMVDQQRLIESIYNQLSVNVRTVDVYFAMQQNRGQYLFYRTDNSMTALGGYRAYAAIAKRMDIQETPLERFEIEYIENGFYGDLYQQQTGIWGGDSTAPYRKVQPDVVSLFHYAGEREYLLTRWDEDDVRWSYHTLYPKQRLALGAPLDVFLGGNSAFAEIRSSSSAIGKLLVFGDRTAAAYLPFLADHYQQTTLVNLYYATDNQIAAIRPDQYDQILFAYGIETFIHTRQPARASYINWSTEDA